jgi:hypothetical protein
MKTPVVEHITPEGDQKKKSESEKKERESELFEISLANVINNASWSISDVLMSTPVTLAHVLQRKEKYAPFDINPRVIVLDELE